jgi:mono/diheme cytochrome c family protein
MLLAAGWLAIGSMPAPIRGADALAPVRGADAPAPVRGADAPAPVRGADAPAPVRGADAPADVEYFERHVRPIFERHCVACHSADTKPAGGFRVDDRNGLVQGGNSGPGIVPGKPQDSLLLKRVAKDAKKRMPAEGEPLSDEQIAVLARWIENGAAWPALQVKVQRETADYEKLRQTHWAWQPIREPAAPAVRDTAWPRSPIDHFVLARLEAERLAPVADADKPALLRRVSFDLTGLPPSLEDLQAFAADDSPQAFATVVERLLKSPAFGEHWARHWLDIARYGESTGPSRNIPYPHAWRYRDYVIDSFNRDVPFTQFVREQLAGDLLPAADDETANRQRIATGFLALGVKDVNQRFPIRFQMDNVDEQIDVVTRSLLGVTVSCARCHDHKFDPVPQADYYALAGIFTSTEMYAGVKSLMGGGGLAYYVPKRLVPLMGGDATGIDPAEVAKLEAEAAEAKQAWEAVRGKPEGLKAGPDGVPHQRTLKLKLDALQAKVAAVNDPAARGLVAHGVRDAEKVGDTTLRVRGEAEKTGAVIPRGFLSAVSVPGSAPVNSSQSGRRELAEWIVSDSNPLTARVFANRVWSKLFGRGLVVSVDNFGVTGEKPTHPELLDHLAATTIADGWSLKRLARRLVLSRVYQLSSDSTAGHLERDPANNWLWRHSPRRLTAEEIRDAMLASAGQLSGVRPEASPVRQLRMVEMRDNGPEARGIHDQASESRARSLYLPQLRGLTPKSLEAFDPVDPTLVSGSRDVTTVPSQALFLLNGGFVRQNALALARELLVPSSDADAPRIRTAYQRVLGREPTSLEIARVESFLSDYATTIEEPASTTTAGKADKSPPRPAAVRKKGKAAKAGKAAPIAPAVAQPAANPDEVDQTGVVATEVEVVAGGRREAAWMAFTQALYAAAEFRYVR